MSFGFGFGFSRAGGRISPPTPTGNFAVLPAAGTPTYPVTNAVLDSSSTIYIVAATVLSSNGTSYTPI